MENTDRAPDHTPLGSHGSVLVFDGDCGFCTTVAQWAASKFTNGEHAEPWQFLSDERLLALGLTQEETQKAAWWVDEDGRRARGHRAVGKALQATGNWRWPLGLAALTPPTSWLAAGVYPLVVRWRYRLPGGTPACRIDTQR